MSRYDHVPARTVRFWAGVDSAVTLMLALPPLAPKFIEMLYWANGLIGGTAEAPPFEPIHHLFVYLTGTLVSVWVVARLLHPVGLFAVIDGWGRLYVALVLAWVVLARDGPPILWLFVFTEGAGTISQLRAAYRRPDANGARPGPGSTVHAPQRER
ncbi:hypothetical protein [Sinimarinibacterium thermocellulolyticum]|uniref:Uncharacterized protein n=1 Tax=Sinimarinibacterium thermocellulolyticum TaxID=3170016 RepID=A0ABV2ABG5_9GAMM